MNYPQALSLLVLRRLSVVPQSVPTEAQSHAAENGAEEPGARLFAGGDQEALARALHRAVESTWLTLDLLLGRDVIRPRLTGPGQEALAALLGSAGLQSLARTPTPFRQPIWRDLRGARTSGTLTRGEVRADDLLRQLDHFGRPPDGQGAADLEWFALWQMADELGREGFAGLKSLLEARSPRGDSLIVGLVSSFALHELGLEDESPLDDSDSGLVSRESARWLAGHAEVLETLLNEAVGEKAPPPTPPRQPAEAAARV